MAKNSKIWGFVAKFLTKFAFFDERKCHFWWQNLLEPRYYYCCNNLLHGVMFRFSRSAGILDHWALLSYSMQVLQLCSCLKFFTCESSYCFQHVLAITILSVHLSVIWVDQSKVVQARITKSLPSAAWKTLVSGTVKLFHKFEGGHLERGR